MQFKQAISELCPTNQASSVQHQNLTEYNMNNLILQFRFLESENGIHNHNFVCNFIRYDELTPVILKHESNFSPR